jgi:hypothetical protein
MISFRANGDKDAMCVMEMKNTGFWWWKKPAYPCKTTKISMSTTNPIYIFRDMILRDRNREKFQ